MRVKIYEPLIGIAQERSSVLSFKPKVDGSSAEKWLMICPKRLGESCQNFLEQLTFAANPL
jgi:hypothetical protein